MSYYNMDELNKFERQLTDLKDKMKNEGSLDLIEVKYDTQFKRFYYFEIDKALDYFNEKKKQGYQTTMKKVQDEKQRS